MWLRLWVIILFFANFFWAIHKTWKGETSDALISTSACVAVLMLCGKDLFRLKREEQP